MGMKSVIEISEDLLRIAQRGVAAEEAGLLRAGGAAEAAMVEEAPKVTGNLADGIRKFLSYGEHKVVVTSTAKYSIWVHEGTGIYGPYKKPIVPTSKKALAWVTPMRIGNTWLAGFMVRRSVKGMKPNPFARRAFNRVEPRLADIFMGGYMSVMNG